MALKNEDVYELLWNENRFIWLNEEKSKVERKEENKNIYSLIFTKINTEDKPINVNGHQ